MKDIKEYIENHKRILFVWGMFCALVLTVVYSHVGSIGNYYAQYKADKVDLAYRDLMTNGKFEIWSLAHTLGWFYIPCLMKLFSIQSSAEVFILLQVIMTFIVLSASPYLVYKLNSNVLTSLFVPLAMGIFLGDFLYRRQSAEFYGAFWIVLFSVPFIFALIASQSGKQTIILIGFVSLSMMVANCFRFHSGLPTLVIFCLILTVRLLRKKERIAVYICSLMMLFLPYNFMARTIPDYVAKSWNVTGTAAYNSSPWHSVLIGFGWEEMQEYGGVQNEYGLTYSDKSAENYILERYSDVEYNSDEYYECCKIEALKIIRENPGFVISGYIRKLFIGIKCVGSYFHLIPVILIIASTVYIFTKRKFGMFIKQNVMKIISLILLDMMSFYPGTITIPHHEYNWGGIGGFFVIMLVIFMMEIDFVLKNEFDMLQVKQAEG